MASLLRRGSVDNMILGGFQPVFGLSPSRESVKSMIAFCNKLVPRDDACSWQFCFKE
jgi:hypothetical protein